MMHIYTAIVLFPQHRFQPEDCHVAVGVRARNVGEALAKAQKAAWNSLSGEDQQGLHPLDFEPLAIFKGKQEPIVFRQPV